jgi:hypothetical protein
VPTAARPACIKSTSRSETAALSVSRRIPNVEREEEPEMIRTTDPNGRAAMRMRLASALAVVVAVAATASLARADASPVGPLPAGPTATISTQKGQLVAVALPHRAGGRVWRIARAFNGHVVTEVSEADVGTNVVLVFRATGAGTTTLTFALTKGETAKAYESRRFTVHVR